MQKKKVKPGMITIFTILIALFAWLQYKIWIENYSFEQLLQLKRDIKTQQAENTTLQRRNQDLQNEVQQLKTNSQAVAEEARKQLGMVHQDETFYRIVDSDSDSDSDHYH
jgi:cell division protein FtsB